MDIEWSLLIRGADGFVLLVVLVWSIMSASVLAWARREDRAFRPAVEGATLRALPRT